MRASEDGVTLTAPLIRTMTIWLDSSIAIAILATCAMPVAVIIARTTSVIFTQDPGLSESNRIFSKILDIFFSCVRA